MTVAAVEKLSNELNIGMLEVCRRADEFSELSRARAKLRAFAAVIDGLAPLPRRTMHMLIDEVLDKKQDMTLRKIEDDSYQERLENIQELNTAIVRYLELEDEPTLFGFGANFAGFKTRIITRGVGYGVAYDARIRGWNLIMFSFPEWRRACFHPACSVDEPADWKKSADSVTSALPGKEAAYAAGHAHAHDFSVRRFGR